MKATVPASSGQGTFKAGTAAACGPCRPPERVPAQAVAGQPSVETKLLRTTCASAAPKVTAAGNLAAPLPARLPAKTDTSIVKHHSPSKSSSHSLVCQGHTMGHFSCFRTFPNSCDPNLLSFSPWHRALPQTQEPTSPPLWNPHKLGVS
ncbi:hypothetical protein P7K49_002256 [Saguinus oedipus]|uniref:Uncharacterized protein n=1 Tax=Saguinus oedipus TaxID=9490 RepID=A0ABQ9WHG4_SAGOE|nr:hypothetical protein P7K49_002256 [Saguinus oedipus]